MTGDWDGNGHTSIGYFSTADGTFHLRNSLSPGPSDYAFGFAPTGSGIIPVTGDWDGDGHTSIGYFNTADGTVHLRNSLSRRQRLRLPRGAGRQRHHAGHRQLGRHEPPRTHFTILERQNSS